MVEEVSALWDWLAITDKPEPCDVIFLFGGAVINIAEKGLELYEQGLSEHVVTTGNTGTFGNPEWDKPIADIFASFLVARGVPEGVITIQNKSMNTLEDVTIALPMLDVQQIPHAKVAVVSRPVHQRRAFATYKKQDPNACIINVPCVEVRPSKLSDSELLETAIRCCQEYERLIQYAAKRDLVAQDIPEEVKAAYESLKAMLTKV